MLWKEPMYSKSQIGRAGKIIKNTSSIEEDRNEALTIINNWRASHAFPLHIIYCYFKRHYDRPNYIIAQRLKRLPSIIHKLQREPTMNLWTIQDLGGCRIIVPTIEDVYTIVDTYNSSRIRHIKKKANDYIIKPKPSGYRSYHLIYKYQSDTKETFNRNMLIEIQIRTKLQHLWATAVETMGLFTCQALKASNGDEDALRFFSLISSLFALKENMPTVPETPHKLNEIITEINILEKKHNYLDRLRAIPAVADSRNYTINTKKGYYLLVLDHTNHQLKMEFFNTGKIEEAMTTYNKFEQLIPTNKLDVVLVSVASFRALKAAYPNYFSDITDFVNTVKDLIINPTLYFKERVFIMYYPVLRWKQGEQQALKNLNPAMKTKITPIIEFPILGVVRPKKATKEKLAETLEEAIERQNKSFQNRINNFSEKLFEYWGLQEVFLDLNSLLNQKNIFITIKQLSPLFNNPCNIIPVINPENIPSDLIIYLRELLSSKTISSLVFRVNSDTDSENQNLIEDIVTQLPINISNCSIIYDLKDVSNATITQSKRSFQSLYRDFGSNFKTVIMLSGALTLPSDFGTDTSQTIPRTDWLTWEKIRENDSFKSIQFGDYTISSANFVDLPFRGAPKIKYTLANNWIVYKGILGRTSTSRNAVQYQKMSKNLVTSINLENPACYGEDQILKCAQGKIEIGSPTSWVAIGINQHITFVVSQLNAIHPVP